MVEMATNQRQCYEISSKPKQYFANIRDYGKRRKKPNMKKHQKPFKSKCLLISVLCRLAVEKKGAFTAKEDCSFPKVSSLAS